MFKKILITGTILGSMVFGSQAIAAEYTVKTNDTLWGISNKHHISVSDLKNWNGLKSNLIHPGQILKISEEKNEEVVVHTIKKGEYLNSIANKYGVSVESILKINPSITNRNLIRMGQNITILSSEEEKLPLLGIDKPEESEVSTSGITIHTIKSGEYLSLISKRYNVELNTLLAFNPQIKNANFVKVGDEVNVPNEELVMLSKIIYLEARGESFEGMVAVGNVVMNRVKGSSFPNTVEGVLYQKGQFTPVMNGKINSTTPNQQTAKAAVESYNGNNLVKDAIFFFAPTKTNEEYINGRKVVVTIGNHTFAK